MRKILASLTLIVTAPFAFAQPPTRADEPDVKAAAASGIVYTTKEGRVLNRDEGGHYDGGSYSHSIHPPRQEDDRGPRRGG